MEDSTEALAAANKIKNIVYLNCQIK